MRLRYYITDPHVIEHGEIYLPDLESCKVRAREIVRYNKDKGINIYITDDNTTILSGPILFEWTNTNFKPHKND